MKKHRVLIIVSLSLMMTGFSCAGLKNLFDQPKINYESFAIQSISLKDIDLNINFRIQNPNAIGITLTGFSYNLEVDSHPFLRGEQQTGLQIPANGSSGFTVPAKIVYSDLFQSVKSIVNNQEAPYRMQGTAQVKTPIGAVGIPFSYSGTFPLLKKPNLALKSLKTKDLSLTGVSLVLEVEIENPNLLELDVLKFNHNVILSGNEIAKSLTSAPMKIAKNGKTQLTLPIRVNFLEAGMAIKQVLQGGSVSYQLRGDMLTRLPGGDVALPYDQGGTIQIQK